MVYIWRWIYEYKFLSLVTEGYKKKASLVSFVLQNKFVYNKKGI